MRLDNPLLVRWEYASEERLEKRNAVLRVLSRGPRPEDASVAAVAALQPTRLLDVGCGLGELGERGAVVATSVGEDNIADVWELIGIDEPRGPLKFVRENGEELLRPHFAEVERHDLEGEPVFEDTGTLRTFVASTSDRAHLAPRVPEISEPFHARTRHVIFVAKGPR